MKREQAQARTVRYKIGDDDVETNEISKPRPHHKATTTTTTTSPAVEKIKESKENGIEYRDYYNKRRRNGENDWQVVYLAFFRQLSLNTTSKHHPKVAYRPATERGTRVFKLFSDVLTSQRKVS
jgi:hypothetical protein